jgi:tetratricopeptide (TPR) repeat protein
MRIIWGIAAMMLAVSTSVQAASYCGDLKTGVGPHDYTNSAFASTLSLVEKYHFTENVEKLIKGDTGSIGGDLDYTLRAFPNHQRALTTMARLALREKAAKVNGASWSVECYFERAMRFKPSDTAVRRIYSSYLFKLGRTDHAIEQLNHAVGLEPENGMVNYDLGLLHLHKKDYKNALTFAKKADALGVPFDGLKKKLMEVGKWDDASGS